MKLHAICVSMAGAHIHQHVSIRTHGLMLTVTTATTMTENVQIGLRFVSFVSSLTVVLSLPRDSKEKRLSLERTNTISEVNCFV